MLKLNARAFGIYADAGKEWLAFVSRRLEEDAAFFERTGTERELQSMMNAYFEYFQKAV